MNYTLGQEYIQRLNDEKPSALLNGRYMHDALVTIHSIDEKWLHCHLYADVVRSTRFTYAGIREDGQAHLIELADAPVEKERKPHTKTKTPAFMNRKKRHFLPPGSEVGGNWYPKYIMVPNRETGMKYGPYLVLVRRHSEDGKKQQVYVGMKGHKVTWEELATINEVWGGENDYIPTGADIRFILE